MPWDNFHIANSNMLKQNSEGLEYSSLSDTYSKNGILHFNSQQEKREFVKYV